MFNNRIRVALILLLAGAAAAIAQVNVIPIIIAPVNSGIAGALLLENNADILLLENGTDQFCLEGGC